SCFVLSFVALYSQWVPGFAGEGGGVVLGLVTYRGVEQEVWKWKLQAWWEIWYREQCFKSWGEEKINDLIGEIIPCSDLSSQNVPALSAKCPGKSEDPGLPIVLNRAIWKNFGDSERSTPMGFKLARENLQSCVKEKESITNVENVVFDLGVMDSLRFSL
nr:hypothetical protein [Tanacetum cinerariifolium]